MAPDQLFNRTAWHAFASSVQAELKTSLDSIPAATIASSDAGVVVEQFMRGREVPMPMVHWDKLETSQREGDIDLAMVPNTMAYYDGEHVFQKGVQFEVRVPFEGNAKMFGVQPESYDLNPPVAGLIRSCLIFTYSGLDADVEGWTRSFEESKQKIESYLAALRRSAEKSS